MQKFSNSCDSHALTNAQNNLQGRTHYVDQRTLAYFKSRVLRARACCDGLLFFIIESVSADPSHTRRTYRPVIFDLWGHIVNDRIDTQDGFKTKAQANARLEKDLAALDARAITLAGIDRANRAHEYDMNDARGWLKNYQGDKRELD